MKVYLRLGRPGFYYAGRGHWVRDREHALDLQTIELATDLGRAVDLASMQIVVTSGDPSCDWFVPLRRPQAVGAEEALASVDMPLLKAASA